MSEDDNESGHGGRAGEVSRHVVDQGDRYGDALRDAKQRERRAQAIAAAGSDDVVALD